MEPNTIFVFGSNLAGIHGAGAARYAWKHHGAVRGVGVGLQGKSYAIPTRDKNIKTLPLFRIRDYVNQFIDFARANQHLTFQVTRVGCGLAGYDDKDIGPMFREVSENVVLPVEWIKYTCNR